MKKIVFVIVSFIGMIVSIPIMIFFKIIKKEYLLFNYFLKPFFSILIKILNIKIEINGKIDYPLGNTLIIANHLSLIDIVILTVVIEQRLIYISKIENSHIPIISSWMKFNGVIFIPRENLKETIRRMRDVTTYLEANQPVMLFPQGTREKNDINFKPGSLKFVHKSKGNILSIGLKGCDEVFKNKTYKKNIIQVYLNDLIKFEEYGNKNLVEVQKNIETIIKEQVL